MMEPIWGSFDANGNPLMMLLNKEFESTLIVPQQQPQSHCGLLVHPPTSANPAYLRDAYSASSASHEPFAFAPERGSDPESILGIHSEHSEHSEHLATRTILENNIDNSSSTLFDGNGLEAPTLQHWESPQDIWGRPDESERDTSEGAVTSPPANSEPNHEEQFGGPEMYYCFSEIPLRSRASSAFELPIQDDFLPYEASPVALSLGDYSDASSYYSQTSSQNLSRPAKIFQESEQTKSGLFSKVLSSVDAKSHECAVCGKRFTRQSSLRIHSYSHTGEKPFKCLIEGCGKEFSVSSNLHRHRKVHGSEHLEVYESEQLSASSIIASSASSSANSFHSNHGRNSFQNFFGRRSSMNLGTSSREISPPPGRRGPLGEAGRAALRAVRAVSACWRCKVLRKKCDPEKPCKACPKNKGSYWHDIGCRRGAIVSETEPVVMCPQAGRSPSLLNPHLFDLGFSQISNEILSYNKKLREGAVDMLERLTEIRETDDIDRLAERGTIENELKTRMTYGGLMWLPILKTMPPPPPLGSPLRACILAIMWEIMEEEYQKPVFIPKRLLFLLNSAACYHSTSPGDELIPQSLICLRTCLESIRIQRRDFDKQLHKGCESSLCRVDHSTNVNSHLKLYLDELSRVIFRKENLQSDRRWWLSVFYSLVVQNYVRVLLISIVNHFADRLCEDEVTAPDRYLHLAVKLFFASSAGYDPISTDFSGEHFEINHFKLARAVVGQSDWAKTALHSSRDYIFRIFDIDRSDVGEELTKKPATGRQHSGIARKDPAGTPCIGQSYEVEVVDEENFSDAQDPWGIRNSHRDRRTAHP